MRQVGIDEVAPDPRDAEIVALKAQLTARSGSSEPVNAQVGAESW